LLAEDDSELRSMLSAVLRRDGHRVLELRDGADLHDDLALLMLDELDPPQDLLVVADLRMPVMDTFTVLQAFRKRGHRPPFILMTAFGDAGTHEVASELGALAVFDKPFDFDDLRNAVTRFARTRLPV
jgi:CheY-like chemotaxis protein